MLQDSPATSSETISTIAEVETELRRDKRLSSLVSEDSMDSEDDRLLQALAADLAQIKGGLKDELQLNAFQKELSCTSMPDIPLDFDGLADGKKRVTFTLPSRDAEGATPYPLWSQPPLATDAVPTNVTLLVGHGVRPADRAAVQRVLAERLIAVQLLESKEGQERRLAREAPPGAVCLLGDAQAIVEAVDGIMERPDRDDVQLAFLPLEHYQLLSDVGLDGPEDGLRALLNGRLRGIDVFKIEELGEGLKGRVWHSIGFNSLGSLTNTYSSAKRFTSVLGKSAVMAAAMYGSVMLNASVTYTIEVPEGEVDENYRQLLAQEREYRFVRTDQTQYTWYRKPLLACPTAQVDDGLFELVLTKAGSRADCIREAKQMDAIGRIDAVMGKDAYRSCVRVSSVVLSKTTSDTKGENMMCMGSAQALKDVGSKVRISALPRALKMFC